MAKFEAGNQFGKGRPAEPAPTNPTTLQEELEASVRRGMKSKSAIERTTAMKIAETLTNQNLTELRAQVKQLETKVFEGESALTAMIAERDVANTKISELQPLADRLPVVDGELNAIKATNEEWRTRQVVELTADSVAQRQRAESALRQASEKLTENERTFSTAGYGEFLERIKRLVEEHGLNLDFWKESATLSPSYYEIFGWPPGKAKLFVALRLSWPVDSPGFRQSALRALLDVQPRYPGEPQSVIPDDAAIRADFFTGACSRFECLDEIKAQADDDHSRRYFGWVNRNALARQENDLEMARQYGIGRDSLGLEPQSITGYIGEHPAECVCGRSGCNPLPARFGSGLEGEQA